MQKKRYFVLLLALAMLLSIWPPKGMTAGEDITLTVGETVTLQAHGSWYWSSDNAENGKWLWEIGDETILGGNSMRESHGRYFDLTGLRAGTTKVTLYYADPKTGSPQKDTWNVTVTGTAPVATGGPNPSLVLGKIGENVKGSAEDIREYSSGVNLVPVQKDGLWGFADCNMELVIPFQYDDVAGFDGVNRYAVVSVDGKKYVIDAKGSALDIAPHKYFTVYGEYIRGFDSVSNFGFASGSIEYYKGEEKTSGKAYDKAVEKAEAEVATRYQLRYCMADVYESGEKRLWYLDDYHNPVDGDYTLVIEVPYELVLPDAGRDARGLAGQIMCEGVMVVRSGDSGLYGAIDRTGALVVPLEYDKLYPSNGGYMAYQKGGTCGLLNNPVNPPAPTPVPTAAPKPTPTAKTKPTAAPEPTARVKPTTKPTSTAVPEPTAKPKPTKKPKPTAIPEATTKPTSTVSQPPALSASDFTMKKGTLTDYKGKGGAITIPKEVTKIGKSAFAGCTTITSVTMLGKVTRIGENAFRGCTGLVQVTLPRSVKVIGSDAFSGCTSLTNITIPKKVTRIENWTFFDCTSLASVTIPSSVTEIGLFAFSSCDALKDVYYSGTKAQWKTLTAGRSNDDPLKNATLHCADADAMPKVGDDVSGWVEDSTRFGSLGLFGVKIEGLWGYMDENKILKIPCEFTEVSLFDTWSGTAAVKLPDEKYNLVDREGNLLLAQTYDHVAITTKKEISAYNKPASGKITTYYYFDMEGNLLRKKKAAYRER